MVMSNDNRIQWIDFYKAIVIITVVIGHTTGDLNKYIYIKDYKRME